MAEQAKSLKVFVSYSRADVSFADQLVLALEDKGFDPILDRHDISGAENWRERLGKLILSADAVAFVLTARSAASEICSWEVDEAVRLGKRIIPITHESVAGVTPPKALSELNWIPFYADPAIPGSGFYYGVKRLMEALSIDLDWLRAQTRYSERALEWAKEKPDDLLLRGEALKEAEAWQARSPAGSQPPELVRDYLAASGDAEQHRQAAAKVQLAEREQALKTAAMCGMATWLIPATSATPQALSGPAPPKASSTLSLEILVARCSSAATFASKASSICCSASSSLSPSGSATLSSRPPSRTSGSSSPCPAASATSST